MAATGFVLHQNNGEQAVAIRLLVALRKKSRTLAEARRSPHWRPLVAEMRTLLPGVACHLRERALLIRRLAQTEWLRFVLSLKQNQGVLGGATGRSTSCRRTPRAIRTRATCSPVVRRPR